MFTSPTGKGVVLIFRRNFCVKKSLQRKILELSGNSRETLKWTLLDKQMFSSAEDYLSFPLTEESCQNLIEKYSS